MKKLYYFVMVSPLLLFVATFALLQEKVRVVEASAPSGLPASVVSRSYIAVGPQENVVLFEGASQPRNCASRVITTYANPIMLNFSTSTSQATSTNLLSGAKGHLQAASSTIAYDSGLYGCDWLAAYGFTATTTITVSEFR